MHVAEFIQPNGDYPISPALQDHFLPFRAELLIAFLGDPAGFSMGTATECMLELPPELEVNESLCAEYMENDLALMPSLVSNSRVIRALRTEWEGRAILGRPSGH